ncbi:MAG TPA: crotonase/enoyl-CoA hydratase family protein [Casimicrobiaceae bacterium]|nr:crotonase/enoyl-CoA hydratase family protein [Casimicrobiaceae bacterium]
MNAVVEFPTLATPKNLTQLDVEFDTELSTLFSWMKPTPRPCFNPTLLEEIQRFEHNLEFHQGHFYHSGRLDRVDYVVFASRVPGVFNLGGDLSMFIQAIMRKDRETLTHYANLCVENQYRRATGFGSNVTTIALLQGKALGGGFEAALACDVIVAERSSTASFPEMLFNLFPGMGALTFLGRKIGLKKAEHIITSGQVFSAKEMLDLGVIDEVVEDGLGLVAARMFIQNRRRRQNAYRSLQRAKAEYMPVQLSELKAIVDIWVQAALQLDTRDLRMMARLVKAQDKLLTQSAGDEAVDALFAPTELAAVSNG